jgi:hypothetical protein
MKKIKTKRSAKADTDIEYVQKKIDLIERGLPVDISEKELQSLENTLRGARSFYVDIIKGLYDRQEMGNEVETHLIEESKNLVGVELALRKIDEFRQIHIDHIKKK